MLTALYAVTEFETICTSDHSLALIQIDFHEFQLIYHPNVGQCLRVFKQFETFKHLFVYLNHISYYFINFVLKVYNRIHKQCRSGGKIRKQNVPLVIGNNPRNEVRIYSIDK